MWGTCIKKLEAKNLISIASRDGKKFFLVHNPRHGIQRPIDAGAIGAEELEEINHLCIDRTHSSEPRG